MQPQSSFPKAVLLILGSLLCTAALAAQQSPPPLQPLLQQMLSGNLAQRANAFWTIKAIPHAAAKPEVQKVLVQVLQREDDIMSSAEYHGLGEGYAEYVGWLGSLVFEYAKRTSSEDRPTLLALMGAGVGVAGGGASAKWLATRSTIGVEDAIKIASSPSLTARQAGRDTLVELVLAARSGERAMTPEHAQLAKQAILAGLKAPDADDRSGAVSAVGMLDDPDNVGLVMKLARGDPDATVRRFALRVAERLAKLPPVHHIGH